MDLITEFHHLIFFMEARCRLTTLQNTASSYFSVISLGELALSLGRPFIGTLHITTNPAH